VHPINAASVSRSDRVPVWGLIGAKKKPPPDGEGNLNELRRLI
jgi:hypothetical protein